MRLASIVGHILELCALVEHGVTPVDKVAWGFFKERKYLGAKDRFRIRASFFGMQRDWRLIENLVLSYFKTLPNNLHLPEGKERFLPAYVAHAHIVFKHPADDIIEGLTEVWNNHFPGISITEYIKWLEEHEQEIKTPQDSIQRLGIQYSFTDWMVNRLLQQYGDETEALLSALNKTARVTLRVNRMKSTREGCRQRLLHEGLETLPTQFSPDGLIADKRFNRMASQAYKEGLYDFQDEGSQLISLVAAPKPGEVVIDACAGGGGKTLHMAEIMNQTGKIIAIDVDMERMKGLETRRLRSGMDTIEIQTLDTVNKNKLSQSADLVLVDAPCSGVGRIRRNPEIKQHLTEEIVDSYPSKQLEILNRNAEYVKIGGRLVYATCSLFKCENEDVINKFLAERNDFKLIIEEDTQNRMGMSAEKTPGGTNSTVIPAGLERESFSTNAISTIGTQENDSQNNFWKISKSDGFIRILPHRLSTDGFFIATMQRQ